MSITYDSANKKITVSGETNCNFEQLYIASVAGGWGVIDKTSETEYRIRAIISLTNSSVLSDIENTLIFEYIQIPQSYCNIIDISSNSTLQFGAILNQTMKTGKQGCTLVFEKVPYPNPFGYSNQKTNINGGKQYYYSTVIRAHPTRGVYLQGVADTMRLWEFAYVGDNKLSSVYNAKGLDVANSFFTYIDIAYETQGTYVGVTFNILNKLYYEIRCKNIYRECKFLIANGTPLSYNYTSPQTPNVWGNRYIDCVGVSYINVPAWECGNYARDFITEEYSFAPKILDSNKYAIIGASIKLYDKNNTLIVDAVTDSSGTITPQDIVVNKWEQQGLATNNYVVATNYNPFTLIVSKDGYETYTSTFDLTEKYRSIITLTPPEYIYIDKLTVVEKLNPKITEESLSVALTD